MPFRLPPSRCVNEHTHYFYYFFMKVSSRHTVTEERKASCRHYASTSTTPSPFSLKVSESDFNDAKMRFMFNQEVLDATWRDLIERGRFGC